MRSIDPERDWKKLLSYLPDNYEELARELRLFNTQWPNAKVTSVEQLLRMILLHVGADMPLRQTVVTIAQGGGPRVSQVYLHQKMRRAHGYLAALVERMVSRSSREALPERWAGYEMLCLDGSTVSGPGAEGADLRMHAVLRLHDLRVRDVRVTSAADGETLKRFQWLPDQLVIVDRGYANPPGVVWTVEHGTDVLVRLNRGALPLYTADDTPIDVLQWCRGLRGHRATERPASVILREGRGARERVRRVDGRLIGFRLHEAEAQEAKERVRREEGKTVTAEQLEAAEYIMLFTSAPVGRLSSARCIEAYRLRWQVELQWKRWKSICHFDKLPNYRDDTMLSWLTAKVLLGLILDRIGSAKLNSSSRPMARQPWKLTAIVWPLIVSAIMPIRLAEAAPRLQELADQLDALDGDQVERRQIPTFRNHYYPDGE
jgi:hypothetical protein